MVADIINKVNLLNSLYVLNPSTRTERKGEKQKRKRNEKKRMGDKEHQDESTDSLHLVDKKA